MSEPGAALVADATLAVKSDVDRYVEQQQADDLARVEHWRFIQAFYDGTGAT